ncbi:MAG TPA: CBS domain-containing protein [Candidatus Polarisedimenticolia bacterium]|nr:CBS domain-containing protein [Candidatus Polarisedimenticolia bacterium]
MPQSRIEEILRGDSIRSMGIEPVPSVSGSTALRDVIAVMQKRKVAAVVITDAGRVEGIFTERDLLNRIVGLALSSDIPIRDVMTRNPRTLSPNDRIADAIRLMTEQGYRHIPLVDPAGGEAGMISARDIVEFIAEHYPQEIFNLPPEPSRVPHRPEGG